ncbi:MAG: multiheme c-type cytochrome, partial [Lysobacterales bacterium]
MPTCSLLLLLATIATHTMANPPARRTDPAWVGAQECQSCHPREYKAWQGSDHDLAMQSATRDTVLGDFDNARPGFFTSRKGNYEAVEIMGLYW